MRSPTPNHVYRGRNVEIQPPKALKFRILPTNLPLRGDFLHSFCQFLRNSHHLYASIGSSYVFNSVAFGGQTTKLEAISRSGGISHKISIAPSGETNDRIKKVRGYKNGTDLYHYAKYGGDRGSRSSCRRKNVMFFVCLFVCLFVALSNYEDYENGNVETPNL